MTGVPQDSVSRLLLFSIFTTMVKTLISTYGVSYHQFADDTQLYTAIKSKTNVDLFFLSYCADAVTGWHIENGLLMNAVKAKVLAVVTCQQIAKLDLSGDMEYLSARKYMYLK